MQQPRSEAGGVGLFVLNVGAFLINAFAAVLAIQSGSYSLLPLSIAFGLLSLGVAFWGLTI